MPKDVTKVRTGGAGLDGEALSNGSNRSETKALEKKLTCMAIAQQSVVFLQAVKHGFILCSKTYKFPSPRATRGG